MKPAGHAPAAAHRASALRRRQHTAGDNQRSRTDRTGGANP
jgi:hypothetical protein